MVVYFEQRIMSARIGKYDVLEILGRGGMGVVYKAYDPVLDREVALKTMTVDALKDPLMRERFYREARAAGRLRHPNIVTIYELGEEDNMPFIAMEYLHGHDLHHMIRISMARARDERGSGGNGLFHRIDRIIHRAPGVRLALETQR